MDISKNPVAVFDSGMGGISVLREMAALMPNEDFIYYGDSANAPYGTKTLEEVRRLTIEHISRLLEDYKAKAVAVACNTATSAAVKKLRQLYPDIPLVGVEPAIKPAVLACEDARVLVMATPMTIREDKFQKLEHLYDQEGEIYELPCPGLMEFVENGVLSGPELHSFLQNLLDPYLDKDLTGIVLGCTHYPFLRKAIQEVAGPDIRLYDGGRGTAMELLRRMKLAGVDRKETDHKGEISFLNSSPDPALVDREKKLFSL